MSTGPVDLNPEDFHYFNRTSKLTIVAAVVASQDDDEGEEVDVLAIRVRAESAPRGSRPIRTYVLPIDHNLSQVLLEQLRSETS